MKCAEVLKYQLEQCMKSPRKRAALEALGVPTPTSKKCRLMDRIKGHLKELKSKKDHSSTLQRKQLVSILIKDSSKTLKELSKKLDQRWHFVASASMLQIERDEIERSKTQHGNALSAETKKAIEDFYTRPECTVVIPDRKMVKKDLVPKSCLTVPMKKLHRQFIDETGKKISLRKFQNLRPQHILTVDRIKQTSCLCKMCTNLAQKLESLKPLLRGQSLAEVLADPASAVKATLCQGKNEVDRWTCIQRECSNCGVEAARKLLENLPQGQTISWLRWQSFEGRSGSRIGNIRRQGSIHDLVEELAAELKPYASHLAVAMWQYKHFRELCNGLQLHEVLTLMDFAENYRCKYQNEVQSAHWSYTQATVFPTVNYYRCACGELVTESVVIITDDLVHDASAVHAFNCAVLQHLQGKRGLQLKIQHQFTDGAASQFKSREPFVDISRSHDDHGIEICRSFFGSSHGKGPCDGIGGLVKSAARRAVLSGKELISNAREMFQFWESNLTVDTSDCNVCCHSRRVFYFVDAIDRKRIDRRPNNPVKGTQKLHCVKPGTERNEILFRHLSCNCQECQSGAECRIAGPWSSHRFKTPSPQPSPGINKDSVSAPVDETSSQKLPSSPVDETSSQKLPSSPVDETSSQKLPSSPVDETSSQQLPSSPVETSSQQLPSSPVDETSSQQLPSSPVDETSSQQLPSRSVDETSSQQLPSVLRGKGDDMSTLMAQLQTADTFDAFRAIAMEIEQLLPRIMPYNPISLPKFLPDKASQTLYPSDAPQGLAPVKIYGDGNCLPRCLSVFAYGDEEQHKEMRLRIAVELAVHKAHYLSEYLSKSVNSMAKFCAQYSEHFSGQVLTDGAIEQIFEQEVMDVVKPATYMGMWRLFAASSNLGKPVLSIYPRYGGFNIRQHLNQELHPRKDIPLGRPEGPISAIMWTHTKGKAPPASTWRPNHFVVCLQTPESKKAAKDVKVGDFLLVGVPSEKPGVKTFTTMVSEIDELKRVWSVFLSQAGERAWKLPDQVEPTLCYIPPHDMIRLLKNYRMKQHGRSVLYYFE